MTTEGAVMSVERDWWWGRIEALMERLARLEQGHANKVDRAELKDTEDRLLRRIDGQDQQLRELRKSHHAMHSEMRKGFDMAAADAGTVAQQIARQLEEHDRKMGDRLKFWGKVFAGLIVTYIAFGSDVPDHVSGLAQVVARIFGVM